MNKEQETREKATRAWAVLVWAARHRQTLTYQDLGRLIGVHHRGRPMSSVLTCLYDYCKKTKGLPMLTALVIDKTTGVPSKESGISAQKAPKEFQRIFQHSSWPKNPGPGF